MFSESIEISGKILLTALLTGIIGAERHIRHKGAGMRTHMLVGISAALLSLISLYVFNMYQGIATVDPTRIIAGIVTGIGFLCAGTIIRGGATVRGLTTAASLWVVSGIGIAVGVGNYNAAILVTLIVFFILSGMRTFEGKLSKRFDDD